MARMIDADAALDRYYEEFEKQDICDGSQDRDWLMRCIEEAPTITLPNEWVSVGNALPPNMDDVLVVVQNNGERWTVTGYYSNTSNVWYAMLNGQDTQMDVLWWMPLPSPPDKEQTT